MASAGSFRVVRGIARPLKPRSSHPRIQIVEYRCEIADLHVVLAGPRSSTSRCRGVGPSPRGASTDCAGPPICSWSPSAESCSLARNPKFIRMRRWPATSARDATSRVHGCSPSFPWPVRTAADERVTAARKRDIACWWANVMVCARCRRPVRMRPSPAIASVVTQQPCLATQRHHTPITGLSYARDASVLHRRPLDTPLQSR